MQKLIKYIPLIFLTVFLRLFLLTKVPARLTTDEMSIGYNAYSILKTGKDEWGHKLPLVFRAFGDYKLPAYIYLTVPFIALFDLNDFSVKLPSAISGMLLVLFFYKLSYLIFKNKKISYLSALVCAISPWAIQMSHQARESNLALLFFTIGFYYFLKSQQNHNNKFIFIAAISLALTFYTYIAYRLIIPIFIVGSILISIILKQKLIGLKKFLITFFILVMPLVPLLLNKGGTARFNHVSIFKDEGVISRVTEANNYCYLLNYNQYFNKGCRIFFNKYAFLIKDFTKNYLSSFSPEFLFINGDEQESLSVPNFGEFFIIFMPFYLLGIYLLFKKHNLKISIFIFTFLIVPIPCALTSMPQIIRLNSLLPFVCIIIGLGLEQSLEFIQNKNFNKFIKYSFVLILSFSSITYFLYYWIVYPNKYDNMGYYFNTPEVTKLLKEKENSYEKIIIRKDFSDFYIALAFYNKIDPSFLQNNIIRPEPDEIGFTHPIQLGKYYFSDSTLTDLICKNENSILFLTNDSEKTPNAIIFKNYANVHIQARLYDVDEAINYYKQIPNGINCSN